MHRFTKKKLSPPDRVAELDISNFVSRETLGQYSTQLEERHRKRGRRAREEKRREKKIHLEERRLMGRYPRYL